MMENGKDIITFQEYAVEVLCTMLTMCKAKSLTRDVFQSYGSKHMLKSGLVAHYASMYYVKSKQSFINFWQNNIKYSNVLLMSKNAKNIVDNIVKNYNGSLNKYRNDNKEKNQRLYWEHITPNEVIWQRIQQVFDDYTNGINQDVDALKARVTACFKGHKLVLLTKYEADILDQKGGRTGQKIKMISDEDVAINRIKILKEENNSLFYRPQKSKEVPCSDEDIKNYFDDGCYII